ncbi:MAG: hypothetical protein ACU0A8_14015 [Limimaricola soesokkakensis]|uniref:hypothetical protein n=1 Tax=Limimaricola soesokkakensis TaxID=1343159 RepID=UPI0040584754
MISQAGARQSGAEGFGEVMSSLSRLRLDHLAAPLARAVDSYLADHARQLRALSRPEPLTAAEEAALASVGVGRGAGEPDLGPVMGVAVRLAAIQAGAIPLKAAAARLGVNDSRLRQRIKARTLYALRQPGGRGWMVPAFQFLGDAELPGLAQVLPVIREDIHPVELESFLTTPQPDLEDADGAAMRPVDWLAQGRDPGAVRALATGI